LNVNSSKSGGQYVLLEEDGTEVLRNARGIYAELIADPAFIHAAQTQNTQTSYFDYVQNNHEYIVHSASIDIPNGWRLVSIQRKSDLLGQMHRIQWIVILVTIGCVLIAILLSRMLMAIFFKPLHNLNELMRKVENNDLSVRFTSNYSDEFSRVGLRFNQMMEQITTLIETIKSVEKEKAQAELKALQAHISPHFLYNAFNTIYWRCQLNRTDDVGEMVLALSQLFQLGLNNGQAITTLDKEISHVTQYLMIQQQCYEELFEFDIQVEDEMLLTTPIVKLILQPLVENSILHGFANQRTGGHIHIDVDRLGSALQISVTDNGEGMDAEAVMIAVTGAEEGKSNSYALFNIYNRLKLAYGDQTQFLISSTPRVATTVTFIIPLEEGAAVA
jgi:two-component system, sensor histidine kinase YesM